MSLDMGVGESRASGQEGPGWVGAGQCPSLPSRFTPTQPLPLSWSRFRLLCHRIITHKMFDHVVLVIIFLNCITIAMERPKIDPHSAVSHWGWRQLLSACLVPCPPGLEDLCPCSEPGRQGGPERRGSKEPGISLILTLATGTPGCLLYPHLFPCCEKAASWGACS